MKNQYFGDQHDFFKYDLLMDVLESSGSLHRLTFIPMLTVDDNRRQGRRTDYERGKRREDLYHFLRYCLARKIRDIQQLQYYFRNRPFQYAAYKDSTYFSHVKRANYFRGISSKALVDALIFFDPDIGLEPRQMKTGEEEKYLLYRELGRIVSRSSPSSVVVVFQYLPSGDRSSSFRIQYFTEKYRRLREELQTLDAFHIADKDIAFFGVAKTSTTGAPIQDLFKKHARLHGLEFGSQ